MRGFTLVELTITLSIAALLTGLGLPGVLELVRDHRASSAINGLVAQVQFARSTAITTGTTVTLCPTGGIDTTNLSSNAGCGKRNSWHRGSLLFVDYDKDGVFDARDKLLRIFPPLSGDGQISWRAFRNRSSLTILGNGLTDSQNGSFRYCPGNNDPRFARQAIINRQARVRHARDTNGDGLREAPDGRPLSCPP